MGGLREERFSGSGRGMGNELSLGLGIEGNGDDWRRR